MKPQYYRTEVECDDCGSYNTIEINTANITYEIKISNLILILIERILKKIRTKTKTLKNNITKYPKTLYYNITNMYKLKHWEQINLGCDPEFFFTQNNQTIGAEKILPKAGINIHNYQTKIIIDGIQAELNPAASTCRQMLANNISSAFSILNRTLKDKNPDIELNFNQTVSVTPEEMASLSSKSQQFGCTPSTNAYHAKSSVQIKDASQYLYRSAGGHIHLGLNLQHKKWKTLRNTKRMIPILDLLLGNTSVLIDRDPGNIERRKNYGRAGEFRLPAHGLEYRTLSNYWLQSYPLMSFAFGMARYAFNICTNNLDKYFLRGINIKTVEQAINTNDFDLAYSIFKKIEKKIISTNTKRQYSLPLNHTNLPAFHHFIKKGTKYWFKDDPLAHWLKYELDYNVRNNGWENFLANTVRNDMNTQQHATT